MKKSNLKLSSYQKLKRENEQLRNDIYTLVKLSDTSEGVSLNLSYKIKIMEDDQLLKGEGV